MKKQLEVGDKIYKLSQNGLSNFYIVDRVTAKRAYWRVLEFVREIGDDGVITKKGTDPSHSVFSYRIASPELDAQWAERQGPSPR